MAAPPNLTTHNLSGIWVMNKSLSDDMDEILRLQGVSWLKRTAISASTLTLDVKHYKDESGVEHIEIGQTLSGGIPGSTENRIMDWTLRETNHSLYGAVVGKSRRVKLDEIENEFLKKGWLEDTEQHGAINAYAESDTPKSGTSWTADQIWGFELVGGERRYARHIDFIGPEREHIQIRLVYDFFASKD